MIIDRKNVDNVDMVDTDTLDIAPSPSFEITNPNNPITKGA
jgi:hypothetical protein